MPAVDWVKYEEEEPLLFDPDGHRIPNPKRIRMEHPIEIDRFKEMMERSSNLTAHQVIGITLWSHAYAGNWPNRMGPILDDLRAAAKMLADCFNDPSNVLDLGFGVWRIVPLDVADRSDYREAAEFAADLFRSGSVEMQTTVQYPRVFGAVSMSRVGDSGPTLKLLWDVCLSPKRSSDVKFRYADGREEWADLKSNLLASDDDGWHTNFKIFNPDVPDASYFIVTFAGGFGYDGNIPDSFFIKVRCLSRDWVVSNGVMGNIAGWPTYKVKNEAIAKVDCKFAIELTADDVSPLVDVFMDELRRHVDWDDLYERAQAAAKDRVSFVAGILAMDGRGKPWVQKYTDDHRKKRYPLLHGTKVHLKEAEVSLLSKVSCGEISAHDAILRATKGAGSRKTMSDSTEMLRSAVIDMPIDDWLKS